MLTCPVCWEKFESNVPTKIFCSSKCKRKNCLTKIITRICKYCGKEYQGTRNSNVCDSCRDKSWEKWIKKANELKFHLQCKECGKQFISQCSNAKFCSKVCRANARNKKRRASKERKCKACWRLFVWEGYSKFCSEKCRKSFVPPEIEKICPICNKNFKTTSHRTKYCSQKCKNTRYDTLKLTERICDCCWKKFIGNRCTDYCSEECKKKWRTKKVIATSRERNWCDWPWQSPEQNEKRRATNLAKWWDECSLLRETTRKKINENNMEAEWVMRNCQRSYARNAIKIDSELNHEFQDELTKLWITSELEFHLGKYDYDIKTGNTLIEINPSHSHHSLEWKEYYKTPDYHYKKTIYAKKHWYRCINVFDWVTRDKVLNLLNPKKRKLEARKCKIVNLDYISAHNFFIQYHLQNNTKKQKNNLYLWLTYKDNLVMCMSFWKPRNTSKYEWEILRLCTHKDYFIIWWVKKIFKNFLKQTGANSVISYCDMWIFDWKVYEQLWFKLDGGYKPSIHRWFMWITKPKKQALEKELWYEIKIPEEKDWHLRWKHWRRRWFDQLLWKYFWKFWKWSDNFNLMVKFHYLPIYDAGQATYVRHKEKEEK